MQSLRQTLFIVGLLLVLMLGPAILLGYGDLSAAGMASSARDRSLYYESAARRLFWTDDFYELAGSAALEAQDYTRAIQLFQISRLKSVLTPNGQFEMGEAYFFAGDREKAIAEWESLPKDDPAAVNAAPYLADEYHTQSRFLDEKQILRLWLERAPRNADVHYRLGLLLFADASPDAIPLLEFASAASPELKPGADGLRVALKTALQESSVAGRLTSCGRTLAAMGEWHLALQTFSQATQTDANDALAWAWLAETLQHTGGPDDNPLRALQTAVKLAPDSAQVHAMFGLYWQRQEDWRMAYVEYNSAAHLEPENAVWQISLGDVYVHLGDLITALGYYQKATDLAPRDAQTWRALALFSVENASGVESTGRNAALRAYALQPENVQNLDVLGRTLMATQQYDAAETFFKKALSISPRAAAPAYHLAFLYLQTSKFDLAKQYFQMAQESDPNGPFGDQAAKVLARYFP